MIADREIVLRIGGEIAKVGERYNALFETRIGCIEAASSAESVMRNKQALLETILFLIPMSSRACYFCNGRIPVGLCCNQCAYGLIHGLCYQSTSDFQKLREKIKVLRHLIRDLYVKPNEEYHEILDGEARALLIKNLKEVQQIYGEMFDSFKSEIERATTVEEVMRAKAVLLSELINNLPMTNETCYFCLANGWKTMRWALIHPCRNQCGYALHHGNCYNEESDFHRINEEKTSTCDAVFVLYFRGDTYEEPEEDIANKKLVT